MQNSGRLRATSGFTLIELLFTLAILGILTAIGAYALVNSMTTARNNSFIEALAQDINLARSTAMAKSKKVQVEFTSTNTYTVNALDTNNQPVTPALATNTNASVVMSGINAGDKLICSSVGFCLAYTSAGTLKTIDHVDIAANGKTRTLSITILGLTRTES